MSPILDVFRFHWRSGARVALRANGVVGASVVFALALDMNVVEGIRIRAIQLTSHGLGWGARAELAGLSVALAAMAMPRVTLGATGWMRSLPVSRADARRGAALALASVQVFTMTVGLLAILLSLFAYHVRLDPAKIGTLPLIYLAAASAVLPVESRIGRMLSVLALAFALPGTWISGLASLVALAAADRVSRGIIPWRRTRGRRAARISLSGGPVSEWMRFTLRTLPLANVAGSVVLPTLCTALAALIVLHNPDIDSATATRSIRIGGMLALIALAGGLAANIVGARPSWPWARSLPWSSRHRVTGDAILIGAASILIPIYFVFIDARSALQLALTVPAIAITAASAIRAGARRQTSAVGEIATVGVVMGLAITFWPWTSALALAAAPILFNRAERRERSVLVTRFEELHHDAAGDPAWMRAS
jgi:hypothetical protein